MAELEPQNNANGHSAEEDLSPKAHFYDYLIVLARYKWTLLFLIFGGTFLVAAYTLIMPQTYTAGATLMPPDEGEGMSLGSLLKGSGSGGFDLGGITQNSSAEVFEAMLGSRTLADSLIDKFNLLERYDLDSNSREIASEIVRSKLTADADKQGILAIRYNAETSILPSDEEKQEAAQLASDIVNEAISILDHINREKMVTRARRSREFLEGITAQKRMELDSAQIRLMHFQDSNKAIAIDQQLDASVSAIANVQSLIQLKELELSEARSDLTPNAAITRSLENQLAELRTQREALIDKDAFGMNLRDIPDLARRYASLKLDLEVATQVYTFLQAQYHQEQVQEARDLPTVSVLDYAVPPLRRSSPRRTLIVAVTFIALSAIALITIFFLHSFRTQWKIADSDRAEELRKNMKLFRKASSR